MEGFILIIIMLQQSYEGFGSGKKHVLDICTKSYANGLGAIESPPYDFLTHQKIKLYLCPGHKTSSAIKLAFNKFDF